MEELDLINSKLGGHNITITGFSRLQKLITNPDTELHVVELGCGGEDNLRVIKKMVGKK